MSKKIIIELSQETYDRLKDQIEEDKVKEETKLEIRTFGGSILFSSAKTTIKEAVEEAIEEDADLEGADLRGADLEGANLRGADLEGADLEGADLEGADFYNTKFYGKGGTTKIKKEQINDFLKALGVIAE